MMMMMMMMMIMVVVVVVEVMMIELTKLIDWNGYETRESSLFSSIIAFLLLFCFFFLYGAFEYIYIDTCAS